MVGLHLTVDRVDKSIVWSRPDVPASRSHSLRTPHTKLHASTASSLLLVPLPSPRCPVCEGWSRTIARNDTWREIFQSQHQFEFDQFALNRAAESAPPAPLPSTKEQRLLTLLQQKQQRNALTPREGGSHTRG